MSRRWFLKKIAALVGLSAAAPVIQASPSRSLVQPIELQRSKLAGFQYHQGEVVWSMLTVGTALNLIRVRVDWQGHKLGYVPRIDNAAVSHLLDNGQSVRAEIAVLQVSDDPWKRVGITIYLGG